ncbi:hypothetical protein LX16_2201 [Stackebrandtia albiflava]|uniref:Uncharacterized protein n=1 Tax=Stackebrandtia albiflava TaxID=406432 RepID=A0A562V0P6_9ACTN|nr:hypothetical protein [Stackebrandtia albiflava]TWJ11479.1 hypothetical protein LX16_2201 [Stackebrandtia albiflava]
MYPAIRITPPPPDPTAVVLGNATLLGIGYLLLRRFRSAGVSVAVTLWVLAFMYAEPATPAWRFVLAAWWIGNVLHAWWLTRNTPVHGTADLTDPDRTRRLRAFTAGVACLLSAMVLGLQAETRSTVDAAARAHTDGDCESVTSALDGLTALHRISSGEAAAVADRDLAACLLLSSADGQNPLAAAATLRDYLDDPGARWTGAGPWRAEILLGHALRSRTPTPHLQVAFDQLRETLHDAPGESDRVEEVVTTFLADLTTSDASCRVRTINDWIRERDWPAPELARPIAAAADDVPGPLLECARDLTDAEDLDAAQAAYTQLLTEFPDHSGAGAAEDELYDVETAIQREEVQDLFTTGDYCDSPAAYRGAPAYRGDGPHPAEWFGINPRGYDFPGSWIADDVDDTELVVCVDGPERGRYQDTCFYEAELSPVGVTSVKFYATKFTVTAYELKTGERVARYTAHIGDPCPMILYYESFTGIGHPPSEVDSDYSDADVRGVFDRLMD